MPNDDLGQFPAPTATPEPPITPTEPVNTSTTDESSIIEDINTPPTSQISEEPFTTPPTISETPSTTAETFEETPDEIPSIITQEPTPIAEQASTPEAAPQEQPISAPEPVPATMPTVKGGSAFGSLIMLILILIAGGALAITVFVYSQSQQLKQQLLEVTQTLEQQKTTLTPTPSPTIIEFPTSTPTPSSTPTPLATESATPTPSPTPTATISAETVLPLSNASNALKVGINHLPNAQMILIKTENATTPSLQTTKYFFRQDLTTKKYFYVLIASNNEPEIVDKAIYVTPDNSIPSLNEMIVGNTLGIDLDEALIIANAACTSNLCATATVKAQFIRSGENNIWQLTFDPVDASKNALVLQLNAKTKEILYKSTGF